MRQSGVRAVLTGHQPHGDAPVIIRCAEDLIIVSADTGYSAYTLWGQTAASASVADPSVKSTRGSASSEVVVAGGLVQNVRVSAVLSDHSKLQADLPVVGEVPNYIGRQTKDGWWVKGYTKSVWLCSRGEGFTVLNSVRPKLTEEDFEAHVCSMRSSL